MSGEIHAALLQMRSAVVLLFLLMGGFSGGLRGEVSASFEMLQIDGAPFSLDDEMRVQGQVVQMYPHLSSGVAVVRAVRINGRGNLDGIRFHLISKNEREALKKMKEGDWLAVTGRWGQFVERGALKSVGFNVSSFRRIDDAAPRFEDFNGRECVLAGTATKGGMMKCGKDSAQMEGLAEWPERVLGKKVEVRGRLLRDGKAWRWINATWGPAELEGMIGEQVTLTGALWSLNGVWWFEREGEDERICLTSGLGPVLTFDTNLYHGTEARVTGKLVRQLRPSLEQISRKVDRDLVPQFTVRDARVEHLVPAGRSWEYGWIHGRPQAMRDGVPLLVDKLALVPGLAGGETKSRLCRLHNSAAIKYIQSDRSAKMTDFLAERMNEPGIDPTLKMVHACVLAARDDERGRKVLREGVADPESPSFPDAVECLFAFPFLDSEDAKTEAQTAWVEDLFLTLIADERRNCVTNKPVFSNEKEDRTLSPATAMFQYSAALKWLRLLPSTRVRKALVDHALAQKIVPEEEWLRNEVIDALCADEAPLDAETLRKFMTLRMDKEVDPRNSAWAMKQVVIKGLRQRDSEVLQLVRPLLGNLAQDEWFREGLTPEFEGALDKMADGMDQEDRQNVRVMLILRGPDPVGKLLTLLDDPRWNDKCRVIWELSHFKDKRVIVPLLGFLVNVKAGLPNEDDLQVSYAIQHAFSAISAAGGDEAVRALIQALGMSFGRAEARYMTDEGLHRIVAANLINMTGESFGVDAVAWRAWLESRTK